MDLPPIRDYVYNEDSYSVLLVDNRGQLLLLNRNNRYGLVLYTGLPPIKRIFNSNPIAILDINDTLTFLDVDEFNMRVIISNILPIDNVKTVIEYDNNLIILTNDDTLMWGNPRELKTEDYRGHIANIYPGALIDSDGTINSMSLVKINY